MTCTLTPFSDLSTMCPLVADSSDLGLTTGQMSQCLDHRFDCSQIKTFSFFLIYNHIAMRKDYFHETRHVNALCSKIL